MNTSELVGSAGYPGGAGNTLGGERLHFLSQPDRRHTGRPDLICRFNEEDGLLLMEQDQSAQPKIFQAVHLTKQEATRLAVWILRHATNPPSSGPQRRECCADPRGLVGAPCDSCGGIVQPEP